MGTSHGVRPSFMALGDAVAAYWLTAPPNNAGYSQHLHVLPKRRVNGHTSIVDLDSPSESIPPLFSLHRVNGVSICPCPKKTSESTFMVRQGTFPSRANNGAIQADAIAQPADQLSDAHASENAQNLRYACGLVIRHPRLLGSRPHGTWSPHPPQPPRDS
jgi:hypothetical protein